MADATRRTGQQDHVLAHRFATGDGAAAAELFDRHHKSLYGLAVSILRSPEDAADAVQNAWLKAFSALQNGVAPVSVKPWLMRIMHNEAVSTVRQRRLQEHLGDRVAAVAPDLDCVVHDRQRLKQVLDDLRELSVRQRRALVLRELAGFGVQQIATVLGISQGAVRQSVCEARRSLTEFETGRQTACATVLKLLDAGDRRRCNSRSTRAHLRNCQHCRAHSAQLENARALVRPRQSLPRGWRDAAALKPAALAPA